MAALLGISPGSGAALIGQVLNCVYRHPVLWDAVRQGKVRWYRALDVIGEVNFAGLSLEAAPFWRESLDAGGCRDLRGRLDLADAAALEGTLDRLAEILAELGDTNNLDIRRATALGILADPSRAQRLLEEGTDTGPNTTTTVVLHLSDASLADSALVGPY